MQTDVWEALTKASDDDYLATILGIMPDEVPKLSPAIYKARTDHVHLETTHN